MGQGEAMFSSRRRLILDIKQAIDVHVRWKQKLTAYVAKPDRSLNAVALSQDNQCELGKWLHGEGQKQSNWAGYAQLVSEHARFHKAASAVVKNADAGQRMTESVSLGGSSEYSTASNTVVTMLMKMMREVKL